MAAYFQMGDNTENLVGEKDLDDFTGIVLSPINRQPEDLPRDIFKFRNKVRYTTDYDIILDPQLYVPRSRRGHLLEYGYFPKNFDTIDFSTMSWWEKLSVDVSDYAKSLRVDAVASPVVLPNAWSEDYYANCVQGFKVMADSMSSTDIRPLFTLIVGFGEMEKRDHVLSVASIVSGANPGGYYLIIKTDIRPRREMTGEYQMAGIMELINALEATGRPVIVSHCDAEMLLFKAAGATHCATGKFFNLRRFTRSRYDDKTEEGGGQLPYWFEQSLLAYLREADVLRLQRRGFKHLLGQGNCTNYWSNEILDYITQSDHKKWLKLGWCQYLSWFGKTERALSASDAWAAVEDMLLTAENNWSELSAHNVIFDDRNNDGSWVRNWRQVLSEYGTR